MLERGTRQACPIPQFPFFALFKEPLGQQMRQSHQGGRNRTGGGTICWWCIGLWYLEEPEESFLGLMTLLTDLGNLSGYKLNLSKTQVMTPWLASKNLQDKYNLQWEAKALKYLGIIRTKDLSKLSQANYEPLSSKIKADMHRWNLIPFLSLNSRIGAVKMNVLLRL